jgi:glucosamine-6-phosphate deaminase
MQALSPPKIVVCGNADQASMHAADLLATAIRNKPNVTLGLATGGTPVAMYALLVKMHLAGNLDFADATTFNLDEYVGLAGDHPQSYRQFMRKQLFDLVNLDPRKTHLPNGTTSEIAKQAENIAKQAETYERLIADSGGIDLQLLGIGVNGHIAFNEPGSSRDSRTRQVDLTQKTIQSNARFFKSIHDVPKQAITMGIGTILEAKSIVLLAMGAGKADAVRDAISGDVSPAHPASFLQTHADVTYVLDEAAASKALLA